MKSIRKWILDVFGFSGNEINGFIILIPLMVLFVFSEPLYHMWVAHRPGGDSEPDTQQFDSIVALWDNLPEKKKEMVMPPVSLFPFDPNTANIQDLLKLGFDESSATRIAAYRAKGGVFRIKSDLLKIYGLDSALYDQLYGYIQLPASAVTKGKQKPLRGERPALQRSASATWTKGQAEQKFDINTADTLQLKSVYGIGSKLAARIVKFRDGLGGFVKSDQLFEVYGLDTVAVARLLDVCFIAPDFTPKKIDINTASEERLSAHPYISYHLARLLVSYRFQHGDFPDVNDIKKLSAVQPQEVDRLLPYLKVKD